MAIDPFYETFETYKESSLFGRYIPEEKWQHCIHKLSSKFDVSVAGHSVENRSIHCVKFGVGKRKILIWSQMHGNESTSTKALFDFFNFYESNTNHIFFQECTFYVIPVLNPDGAIAYTRLNANKVDLNRDAFALTQPESNVLRDTFNTVQPDYCLNLHGQRTIFGAGETGKPATLSFLAPAFDETRAINSSREQSMHIIGYINQQLQKIIPGQVGLYDDTFNKDCVGDTFQGLGVPTILFEAGHYPDDYDREYVRRLFYSALVASFNGMLTLGDAPSIKEYQTIPINKKCFYDIILRNVRHESFTHPVDLAFQFQEQLKERTIHFVPKLEQIGKLSSYYGHFERDGKKRKVSSATKSPLAKNYSNDFVYLNDDKFALNLIKN